MIARPMANKRWHDISRLCSRLEMEVATEHQGKGDNAKAKEYWQKDQEHSRPADEHSNMAACQACHCNDAFEAGLSERACNPIAISDAPPTIMLIPISSPIFQAEVPGRRDERGERAGANVGEQHFKHMG